MHQFNRKLLYVINNKEPTCKQRNETIVVSFAVKNNIKVILKFIVNIFFYYTKK